VRTFRNGQRIYEHPVQKHYALDPSLKKSDFHDSPAIKPAGIPPPNAPQTREPFGPEIKPGDPT
jgi:hypothetical protein